MKSVVLSGLRRGTLLVLCGSLSSGLGAQEIATLANLNGCVSPQEILARANNEGQYMVLTGDQPFVIQGKERALRHIWTSNVSFTLGYEVGSDGNGNFCKVDTYKEVSLLDGSMNRIDPRTVLPVGLQATKNSLSNAVLNATRARQWPLMQYKTTFTGTGAAARATIVGELGKAGSTLYADKAGMVKDVTFFDVVKYTQSGLDLLHRRQL